MSEERRLDVLRAIVQDYVATSEPVGSKALLDRHHLGVSAATIRNDMAALEEEGLISAPHTSAGRVPTDAGYRRFVDRIDNMKPLSRPERGAIETFLEQAADLDDVVDRTVRLLSSLTQQVAVMQYPTLNRATVRHIELVSLTEMRLMTVIILSTGRVHQRVVSVAHDPAAVDRLRTIVNEQVQGKHLADASVALLDWGATTQSEANEPLRSSVAGIAAALGDEREERVVMAGTANLARAGGDFARSVGPVLDALEEHVVLLRLFQQMAADDMVMVSIGEENTVQGLEGLGSTSIVSTRYTAGGLGVLGPTRMDYPTTMAAVRAVARYVSEILEQ
ncbi:heat-inducible transcriptional repressor HrcA [Calidifontibacter terrae]